MLKKIDKIIFFHFSIIILLFILLTYWSWRKWPDPLVDFGRELYIPWQINQGKLLYKDIKNIFGPFSSYFNALIFYLFGISLNSIIFTNIFLCFTLGIIIYFYFYDLNKWSGFISTLLFFSIFSFSQYTIYSNYNFICPYSHEAIHGIFFSILILLLLKKNINSLFNNKFLTFFIGISTGIVFLTKPEIFTALLFTLLFYYLFIYLFLDKKSIKRDIIILILSFIIPIFLFYIYFSYNLGLLNGIKAIISSWIPLFKVKVTNIQFYKNCMGINNLSHNLLSIFLYFLFIILILLIIISLDILLIKKIKDKKLMVISVYIILFITPITLLCCFVPKSYFLYIVKPLPLFNILIIIYLLKNLFFKRKNKIFDDEVKNIILLSLWGIFSLFLTLKIFFNYRFYHYGFYLSFGSFICFINFLGFYLPFKLNLGNYFRIMGLSILIAFTLNYMKMSNNVYKNKNLVITGIYESDKIYCWDKKYFPYYYTFKKALYQLKKIIHKHQNITFFCYPHPIINYLLRKNNPTPYIQFNPLEIILFKPKKILSSLKKNKPNFIVLSILRQLNYNKNDLNGLRWNFLLFLWKDIFKWIYKNYKIYYYSKTKKYYLYEIIILKIKHKTN